MELKEVQQIWDDTFEVLKPYFTGGDYKPKRGKDGLDEWPDFWDGYRASVDERMGLLPHIEHGCYPEKLFTLRAPNQTDKEAEYIRDNFRQVTLPIYADYENTILRSANESNWQIDYDPGSEDEDGQKDFVEYVTTGVPQYESLFGYWKYVLPRIKTADAMGVLAILPQELKTVETEEGTVTDPDSQIEPVPVYFPVNDVWGYSTGAWYLVLTQEKSEVKLPSGKMSKEGLVLMLIDDEWIWRIEQTGEKIKKTFEIIQWWQHGVKDKKGNPAAPATFMKGTPTIKGGSIVWKSHFMPAKPPCDQVLLDNSYLGLSKANGVFPYLVMIGDDCDFVTADKATRCTYGKLLIYGEDGKVMRTEDCPACKGTGHKSRLSPAGRLLINPKEVTADGKGLSVKDSMDWVSPEITTLEFLQKQIEQNMDLARSLMHIDSPKQTQMDGGDQPTATKSGIDLRNKYAFIKPISDQYFDLLEFMLDATGQMRYGDSFKGVEISRPTSFDMRTEQDFLDELAIAYEKGLPIPVIQHIFWGYLLARYGSEDKAMKAFETISTADELFCLPFAQVQWMLAQGAIEKWEIVLHQKALSLYEKLADQGKLTGDPMKDAEAIKAMSKQITPKEEQAGLMRIVDKIGAAPRPAA